MLWTHPAMTHRDSIASFVPSQVSSRRVPLAAAAAMTVCRHHARLPSKQVRKNAERLTLNDRPDVLSVLLVGEHVEERLENVT